MDTSETYIKMCDCEEIQGEWALPPEKQDFVYHIRRELCLAGFMVSSEDRDMPEGFIWLPRQDQIQELIRDYYAEGVRQKRPKAWFPEGVVGLTYVLKKFNEFAPSDGLIAHEVKSFEHLWLAFYMHEKHGKVWDGERWKS